MDKNLNESTWTDEYLQQQADDSAARTRQLDRRIGQRQQNNNNNEIVELRRVISAQECQLVDRKTQECQLKQQLDQLKNQFDRTQQELLLKDERLIAAQRDKATVEVVREAEKSGQKIGQLQERNESLIKQTNDLTVLCSTQTKEILMLQSAKTTLETQLNDIRSQRDDLQKQVDLFSKASASKGSYFENLIASFLSKTLGNYAQVKMVSHMQKQMDISVVTIDNVVIRIDTKAFDTGTSVCLRDLEKFYRDILEFATNNKKLPETVIDFPQLKLPLGDDKKTEKEIEPEPVKFSVPEDMSRVITREKVDICIMFAKQMISNQKKEMEYELKDGIHVYKICNNQTDMLLQCLLEGVVKVKIDRILLEQQQNGGDNKGNNNNKSNQQAYDKTRQLITQLVETMNSMTTFFGTQMSGYRKAQHLARTVFMKHFVPLSNEIHILDNDLINDDLLKIIKDLMPAAVSVTHVNTTDSKPKPKTGKRKKNNKTDDQKESKKETESENTTKKQKIK